VVAVKWHLGPQQVNVDLVVSIVFFFAKGGLLLRLIFLVKLEWLQVLNKLNVYLAAKLSCHEILEIRCEQPFLPEM